MALDKQEIFEKIRALVAQQLNKAPETITLETTLEEAGADSLDQVEIIMKLEETFNVEINDEEAACLKTLSQLVNYIEGLQT